MSPALRFLCAAVFILACCPRLNVSVGPIPLHAVDVCLVGALYFGLKRRKITRLTPDLRWGLAILYFAVASEAAGMVDNGTILEGIYMIGRMVLAVSLLLSMKHLVRDERDLHHLLRAGAAGMLVTTLLMIATSLPPTRGMVSWLFEINMLTPVGDSFFEKNADLERGTRGQSLVGYNIISAWFICLLWPMAIILYRAPQARGTGWKWIATAAVFLGPFGVLFSYSRGALLGLGLLVAAMLGFGGGRLRTTIAVVVLAVSGIIWTVGVDSNLFYFERIERRTQATMSAPFDDDQESERFYAYIDPFLAVAENPSYLFYGDGLAVGRAKNRGYVETTSSLSSGLDRNLADHAVFAKATLTYGMLAAFCYLVLYTRTLRRLWGEVRFSNSHFPTHKNFSRLSFAAAIAMSAWVAFDKGIVIQPRGAMMFFFIVSLPGVCQNLRETELSTENALTKEPTATDWVAYK